jgi:hypothetical protein
VTVSIPSIGAATSLNAVGGADCAAQVGADLHNPASESMQLEPDFISSSTASPLPNSGTWTPRAADGAVPMAANRARWKDDERGDACPVGTGTLTYRA